MSGGAVAVRATPEQYSVNRRSVVVCVVLHHSERGGGGANGWRAMSICEPTGQRYLFPQYVSIL